MGLAFPPPNIATFGARVVNFICDVVEDTEQEHYYIDYMVSI